MADNNTAKAANDESGTADANDEEDPCSENTEPIEEMVYQPLNAPPENE